MNDQAAGHAVRTILDPRKWAVQHVTQIPSMLARWEGLQREHFSRTQERVLTPSAARALLMEMIPTRMAEHVKVQTMLLKREDLTYDKLRSFIVDYCQSVAPLQPTPMDVNSFCALDGSGLLLGVP